MANIRSHIAVVQDLNGNRLPTPNDRRKDSAMDLKTYQSMRMNLIEAEKQQRFDAEKLSNLTGEEKKANEVVERLKQEEEAKIYNKADDFGAIKGMEWEGAKHRGVMGGELYKIIEKVRYTKCADRVCV